MLMEADLGSGSCGKVLAVRWQMGELDRNFITMHTSSGDELNIIGDRCIAELKYCSVESFSYVIGWGLTSSEGEAPAAAGWGSGRRT